MLQGWGSAIWAWWPKRVEPSVLSSVLPYEKETQVQRGPSLVLQAFPIARSSGVGVPVSIEEERGRSPPCRQIPVECCLGAATASDAIV